MAAKASSGESACSASYSACFLARQARVRRTLAAISLGVRSLANYAQFSRMSPGTR